jgi:hypothetical protein
MAFIAGVNRLNLETVVDGKVVSKMNDAGSVMFNADGTRFAVLGVGMGGGQVAFDGADKNNIVSGDVQYSPDGKHVRMVGQRTSDHLNALFVDGEALFKQTSRFTRSPTFSPDGNHLYWTAMEVNTAAQPPRQSVIYVDNKPIGKWNSDTNQYIEATPLTWEVGADNVLTTLMAAPEGIKKLRITPDLSVTVATMLADVRAAEAKALADAQAAREKSAADAAQKKADAEAAAKKAQEDAAKTRADRAAAQQKAREDAAAARAAAQQKARDDAAGARAARQQQQTGQ